MSPHFFYDPIKRTIDVLASLFLLLILAPFLLLVAMLVQLDGGSVLFKQLRVGLHGQPFLIWKFRSMIPNADEKLQIILEQDDALREQWDVWRKFRNDPRTTKLGHWLRRTSIDELPQLWNVLMGDMSLVGPRPILTTEINLWGPAIVDYESVRPGITGLWQVSGRNRLSYDERIRLDLIYIRSRSWFLDTWISIKTIRVVLLSVGAH